MAVPGGRYLTFGNTGSGNTQLLASGGGLLGALGNNSVPRPQWDAGYPTRGDILLDYSGNDVPALVARLLLAFCLIFTYPLAFR